jgi:hypothetical protein
MSPQSGNEVVINVSGKMADGKVASDKRCLESKVPGPTGTIRGDRSC